MWLKEWAFCHIFRVLAYGSITARVSQTRMRGRIPRMPRKRILFICGSMNQTTQMHQIARELPEFEHSFTPYYCDPPLDYLRRLRLLEFAILGNRYIGRCLSYLKEHRLTLDFKGRTGDYDLVVTCQDLVVPRNIRDKKTVLVQEGMTDPETWVYRLIRRFRFLPRWLASTATTGMSDRYDKFCVASEGYKALFMRKGVRPEKIVVTGIPNFDNCARYLNNAFPHRHYVLVCTSDRRETYQYENRKRFILNATRIANGRPIIFKLHPNENVQRATREINRYAPGALVLHSGNTEEMIANCDVLITRYSSTVYVGLALAKEVYSDYDVEELRTLTPLQNASAAKNIAAVCRELLDSPQEPTVENKGDDHRGRLRRYFSGETAKSPDMAVVR